MFLRIQKLLFQSNIYFKKEKMLQIWDYIFEFGMQFLVEDEERRGSIHRTQMNISNSFEKRIYGIYRFKLCHLGIQIIER